MPRTIPKQPRERTLQLMEAVRENAPAAPSMRALATTLDISTVYLYDLIAWMPDGAEFLAMVAENKRRAHCGDVHPIMEALYRERKAHGLTLKQVAAALGWTPERLRNYEKGENRTPLESVDELAHFYGLGLKLEVEALI